MLLGFEHLATHQSSAKGELFPEIPPHPGSQMHGQSESQLRCLQASPEALNLDPR